MKVITDVLDSFFIFLNFGAHKNTLNFHFFICIINLVLSIYPILCYMTYSGDAHVVFWVGPSLGICNLLVPLTLFMLNIGVNMFSWYHCNAFAGRKFCFWLFVLMGSVLVGLGIFAGTITRKVAEDLTHNCGQTPMTQRVEQEWTRLNQFADMCGAAKGGRRPEFIGKCPGYGAAFPSRVYPNYIEDLEYDLDCTGFCRFWARPIFNMDADRGQRCATVLAARVEEAGAISASYSVVLGIVLVVVGACLAGYDHL